MTADEANKISFKNNSDDQCILDINKIIKAAALKGEREVKCYLQLSHKLIEELDANGFYVKKFATPKAVTGYRISWYL